MLQTQNSATLRQRKPVRAAAIAGGQGAMLLLLLQLTLHALDMSGLPFSVVGAQTALHLKGVAALALALGLTGLAGLLWGALYGVVMPRFTVVTGVLFGLAPWFCSVLFAVPLSSRLSPAGADLKGIFLSLIQLMLWGAFVGRQVGEGIGNG